MVGLCAGVGSVPCSADDTDDLKPLVEQIARGDADAKAAADQLIERVVGPLTKALEHADSLPIEQQQRVEAALARVTANLRLRLFRASLPEEDRKLLDGYIERQRALCEDLFTDDSQMRIAALHRIPLAPDSAAGVLVAAKVGDSDFDVVEEALAAAEELRDEVVARGLIRVVEEAMRFIETADVPPVDRLAYGVVYAELTRKIARIVGLAKYREGAATIQKAIAFFDQPATSSVFQPGVALEALGQTGDESAVPLLLRYLDSREISTVRYLEAGRSVSVTVGDAALLALARIYKIEPESLGFHVDTKGDMPIGFLDEPTRRTAHVAFRKWQQENEGKAAAERTPLTTQPASEAAESDGGAR